jgi:hypothetical protein
MAESGKWNCDRCRGERLRLLGDQLQNAMLQIEDLKRKNKELEERLRVVEAGREVGRHDTVQGHQQGAKCLVLGDSKIMNVGTEDGNIMVECFPGIRTEQLHRMVESRDLRIPDSVVFHVGTNDLRRTVNLDYVMGEVHALVNTAKAKLPKSRIVLSGVLRRSDVSWRRI